MSSQALGRATKSLVEGGVNAYPTEYCYGLGCDPMNRNAVTRILEMKKRGWSQGLIVIAADIRQLAGLVNISRRDILHGPMLSWPGPHTWLLPALPRAPKWICGKHETIAVRITAHPTARSLCRQFQSALVSTSANRSGRPALRSFRQVSNEFTGELDFILAGSVGKLTEPSSIRDAESGRWLRGG